RFAAARSRPHAQGDTYEERTVMNMAVRIVLFVLILLFATTSAAVRAAGGHGSVFVTTLPPGATVWLDGTYMGETPLFVDGLDGGRHTMTLTRAGWQPQSTGIDVTVGRVTTVSAVLTANQPMSHVKSGNAKGMLSIRSANGAKVFVDGMALQEPYESQSVTSGDHILLVVRGNERATRSIRVYPGTTTTISLAPRGTMSTGGEGEDMLAALADYVPPNDFTVSGDEITVHYKGIELECTVGSRTYYLNGKPGTLSVAPAMVGAKPYLPMSLLTRIASQGKSATH
ncbi:MAG TPA: PEGA domain-containing protein, partial [Candidatus Acidoferrales bacterium]|nr:PEGA domain-containing protein [Candidatus Acidoferrales bacterium]